MHPVPSHGGYMKLSDILKNDAIIAELSSTDKLGVLEELSIAVSKPAGTQSHEILNVLLEREKLGSTGIGGGIGIPHGKLASVKSIIVGFGRSIKGVEFDSLDNRPVNLLFILLTPENSTGSHLRVLAHISKLLKNDDFKENLIKAGSIDEIKTIIQKQDEEF